MTNTALRRQSGESTTILSAPGRRKCTIAWTTASTTQRIRETFGSTASDQAGNPSNATMQQSLHPRVTTIQLQTIGVIGGPTWATEWEATECVNNDLMSLDLVFQLFSIW